MRLSAVWMKALWTIARLHRSNQYKHFLAKSWVFSLAHCAWLCILCSLFCISFEF
jgi:hypothetical protein